MSTKKQRKIIELPRAHDNRFSYTSIFGDVEYLKQLCKSLPKESVKEHYTEEHFSRARCLTFDDDGMQPNFVFFGSLDPVDLDYQCGPLEFITRVVIHMHNIGMKVPRKWKGLIDEHTRAKQS